MHIILIGYMGCGKSTLGKKLAKQLGFDFLDTDAIIESKSKKSIAAIFKEFGEQKFRELEMEVLSALKELKKPTVIATGGGMPCHADNMEVINQIGLSVYLYRPPKELAHRIENGTTKRPIVEQYQGDDLIAFITKHLLHREQTYRQATIILPRNKQSVGDVLVALDKH